MPSRVLAVRPMTATVSPALTACPTFKSVADFAQVGVEGVNLQALDLVPQDEVVAVVRQRWPRADIGDRAVGGGQHRVGWLAMPVALEAADVEALVHLPAAAAHTAEGAGHPRLAGRADEESLLAPLFEERVIGSGKLKGLRLGSKRNETGAADYRSIHV